MELRAMMMAQFLLLIGKFFLFKIKNIFAALKMEYSTIRMVALKEDI